jgi:hypothetical protein
MSDLERRSGSRPSRRAREKRAYNLVVAGSLLTAVFVVGTILAILTSFGMTIPVIAAILAVVCVLLFRRTLR